MLTKKIYTFEEIYPLAIRYKKQGNIVRLSELCACVISYANTESNEVKKVELFNLIGLIYSLYPDHNSAVIWFSKALELHQREIVFISIIKSLIALGKYEKASVHISEALALHPDSDRLKSLQKVVINALTIHYLDEQKFEECSAFFKEHFNNYELVLASGLSSSNNYDFIKKYSYDLILATRFFPVKEYCLAKKYFYREVETHGQKNVVYLASIFNGRKIRVQKNIEVPKRHVYISEIPNATLLAGTGIVLTENNTCALDDTFFVFDRYRIIFDAHLSAVIKSYSVSTNSGLICTNLSISPVASGIYIGGAYSPNFYHWMIEHLSLFWTIEQFEQYRNLPIIVDEKSIEHPNMRAALDKVNTFNREIVSVSVGSGYRFDKLIVPSRLVYISPSVRDHLRATDFIVHREAVEFLRKIFFIPSKQLPNRLLFLGRKTNVATRISNQEEIQNIFQQCGFEIVYPEELSLSQNMELFAQAKVIAGATGAAMTNIIFAPKNAKIICMLMEEAASNTIFSNISGIIGQQMIYILGKSNKDSSLSYHSSFTINPSDVANCLDILLKM